MNQSLHYWSGSISFCGYCVFWLEKPMQDNTWCVTFGDYVHVQSWYLKKLESKPFVAIWSLTSWSEIACLIYICQQEGDFERRCSKPASLRKSYNLHGYVLCVWDTFSQRLQGEVCFGDYLLCECWGRQQKICVSSRFFSLLVVSIWGSVPWRG